MKEVQTNKQTTHLMTINRKRAASTLKKKRNEMENIPYMKWKAFVKTII